MPKQLDDPDRVTEVLVAATTDLGFLTSRDAASTDAGAALAEGTFSHISSHTTAVMDLTAMPASTELPAIPAFASDGAGGVMVTVSRSPSREVLPAPDPAAAITSGLSARPGTRPGR